MKARIPEFVYFVFIFRRDPRGDRFQGDPRQRDMRDRDLRERDRDMRGDRDLRMGMDRERDRDLRPERVMRDSDLRERDRDLRDPRMQQQQQQAVGPPNIPPGMMTLDPRARARAEREQQQSSSQAQAQAASKLTTSLPAGRAGFGPSNTDSEKAALIMQVLQLSEEQIAMLPPEQRQSILVLKEQIAKTATGSGNR